MDGQRRQASAHLYQPPEEDETSEVSFGNLIRSGGVVHQPAGSHRYLKLDGTPASSKRSGNSCAELDAMTTRDGVVFR